MPRVMVTGADGQLGSEVVRELLRRDYEVRALVQPGRTSGTLRGLEVERVLCDILERGQLQGKMKGCDAVIHTAASEKCWPRRSKVPMRVNVDGTRNIIREALSADVGRFVHVGSASSFLPGSAGQPGDEARVNTRSTYRMRNIESKHLAQEMVLRSVDGAGLPALVVNPTFMIGPFGDPAGSSGLLIRLWRGAIPLVPPGGRNFVFTGDVAVAICNALSRGRLGQCYILGHENLSFKTAFLRMCSVLGVRPPQHTVGPLTVHLAGLFKSLEGAILRTQPSFSFGVARVSARSWFYRSEKARREIDLPQTSLETASARAWRWFREAHYV